MAITILAIQVTKATLWDQGDEFKAATFTAGNSLASAAAFCVVLMLAFEHRYAMQSSMPLSLYLSAVTISDILQARSQLMRPGLQIPAILTTTTAVLNFILVILLEVPKKLDTVPESNTGADTGADNGTTGDRYNQESTGGFWNRTLVLWINLTLCNGFSKTIRMQDLTSLGPDFSSENLSERFTKTWEKGIFKTLHYKILYEEGN